VSAQTTLTTDAVELPGVRPADPPTELLPGRLWQGGCPVDFDWVREAGITAVVDIADADAHPPAGATDGLVYLKAPLVDGDSVPDPALTLRLARLVAGLVDDGYRVLVHCTFGRNRSGLMSTLVVRQVLGVTGAEALDHVQARRDDTVNNATFAEWLRALPAPR
jgi:protein-tyrosine phosphatase